MSAGDVKSVGTYTYIEVSVEESARLGAALRRMVNRYFRAFPPGGGRSAWEKAAV
jgi:hypothetical protein